MDKNLAADSALIRLDDYRPPAWRVAEVELEFDLDVRATEVLARLHLRRDAPGAAPLTLDGVGLELLHIALDGEPLDATCFRYAEQTLIVDGARDGSVLETRVRIDPAANTAFEGLYLSGAPERGFLLTQCEAQGFRHISFFPDRPDVLARYTITLRADRARFPVLLAGGDPDGAGELADGRHWARFVDPHPKPSYLFALVAGHLEKISRDYRTADGRDVTLIIWAEADAIGGCGYALDALERAMRWDERAYGRNYDLSVFHVVATHDFNMGAMENKGLNIFNTKCLLADASSSTDDEYRRVESVVAHEYFHNWSGNRVTCRDWFQLSLKEGLTVFREHQFCADMHSRALKRIEDVALLRRAQFPEDAGPLSHPVRPAAYREINNFYTATVYEKGAELVRMLAGRLGENGFRRGMDRYFAANDGRAATIEDFLAALGQANAVDLSPYLAWYARAGTPRLRAVGRYDAARREYALTLSQHLPPREGQSDAALPIPVRVALFDRGGALLPLHGDGIAPAATEAVLELDRAEATFVFRQLAAPPVPSLLRGFSAPVLLEIDYPADDLAVLLRHDPDGFNRWEAAQQLAGRAFDEIHDAEAGAITACWAQTLRDVLASGDGDAALLADLLTPPGEVELAERRTPFDPARIHQARERLQQQLAATIGADTLRARYAALAARTAGHDADAQAARRLRLRLLAWLASVDPTGAHALAWSQFEHATGMTDRLGALALLVRGQAARADEALARFRARHAGNPLAMDKWFAVQAQLPGEAALPLVRRLEVDPDFTLRNPNRVYALLGTFARANPSGFHRVDGEGYRWLAGRLAALDALNPQVAARLATAFNGWDRLEPGRRAHARAALEELAGVPVLSRNLKEIVGTVLADRPGHT